MDLLLGHWHRNKDDKQKERWPAGSIYVNHWEVRYDFTMILSILVKRKRSSPLLTP